MKKKVPVIRVATADVAARLPETAEIALAGIAETMREGLLAFTTAAGLAVFRTLLDDELAGLIGPKHAKQPDRVGWCTPLMLELVGWVRRPWAGSGFGGLGWG